MQINTPSCTEAHSVSVKIGGEEGGEYDRAGVVAIQVLKNNSDRAFCDVLHIQVKVISSSCIKYVYIS